MSSVVLSDREIKEKFEKFPQQFDQLVNGDSTRSQLFSKRFNAQRLPGSREMIKQLTSEIKRCAELRASSIGYASSAVQSSRLPKVMYDDGSESARPSPLQAKAPVLLYDAMQLTKSKDYRLYHIFERALFEMVSVGNVSHPEGKRILTGLTELDEHSLEAQVLAHKISKLRAHAEAYFPMENINSEIEEESKLVCAM